MKTKFTHLILLLLAVFFYNGSFAQDGSNDLTFNPADTGYNNGTDGEITSVLALPDGKIVIAGFFNHYTGIDRSKIARINADETLDTSFNPGEGANKAIDVLLRQPDGKIIIGGRFTEFNGVSRNRIARLNTDGSLDLSFNPGAGSAENVFALAIQADGKILVGGDFTVFNGVPATHLVRLNTDGTVDTSFVISGVDGPVKGLAVQSNGKIIAVGAFYGFNGDVKRNLVRLNTDGSTDTTFITGVGTNQQILAVALNNAGKIFIGGRFTSYNGQSKAGIVGLNEDGSLNTAFNVSGGVSGWVNSIVIQSDDKVLLAGSVTSYKGFDSSRSIMRIKSNGDRDASFTSLGVDYEIRSMALKPDGKIVIVGPFMAFNDRTENFIACLNPDSSRDNNFDIGPGTGADNTISVVKAAPNSKIVIGGSFYNYNGIPRRRIARIEANGDVDESFNPGEGLDGWISDLEVLADGKIMVAGHFSTYKGLPVNRLIRLNANGSLDTSFVLNLPYKEESLDIQDIVIQPDGKMLLSGSFRIETDDFPGIVSICRINANGSFDSGFNNENVKRYVTGIVLQPDNKILLSLGGAFWTDIPEYTIMRLNNDGSIDTLFTDVPLSYINFCNDIALQSDGKIVIAGQEIDLETGISVKKLARINADGTFDTSFVQPDLDYVPIIKLQADGKIIATNFYKYNGENVKGLARINQNGSLDETFNVGQGIYAGGIYNVLFQPAGKMIIVGDFLAYDGVGRNRIVRVKSSGAMDVDTFSAKVNNVFAYRDNNTLQVTSTEKDIKSVMVYNLEGKLIAEKRNVGAVSVALNNNIAINTIIIVKVKLADGTQTVKKIYY